MAANVLIKMFFLRWDKKHRRYSLLKFVTGIHQPHHSGHQSSLWLPHNTILCGGNKTLTRQNAAPYGPVLTKISKYHNNFNLADSQKCMTILFPKSLLTLDENFNMGVNGKIIKCAISWKRPTVERKGWKFGTRCPKNSICRVLFRSGHFSSLWGHSVHNFRC